jgi:dienelactone hydrolase
MVPSARWLPSSGSGPFPLLMLGHGGSKHKRAGRIVEMGEWCASAGFAAVAIDGPFHGERVPSPITSPEAQARMVAAGVPEVLGRMVADWEETLAALVADGVARADRVGYFGFSLGSRFGVPLAAAMGDRLRCAVLGKFGLTQGPGLHPGLDTPDFYARDAARITAPALFHLQWDDEVFPRDGQLSLFDRLGSPDKQLIAFPGPHGASHPHAAAQWRDFLSHHLG